VDNEISKDTLDGSNFFWQDDNPKATAAVNKKYFVFISIKLSD